MIRATIARTATKRVIILFLWRKTKTIKTARSAMGLRNVRTMTQTNRQASTIRIVPPARSGNGLNSSRTCRRNFGISTPPDPMRPRVPEDDPMDQRPV